MKLSKRINYGFSYVQGIALVEAQMGEIMDHHIKALEDGDEYKAEFYLAAAATMQVGLWELQALILN